MCAGGLLSPIAAIICRKYSAKLFCLTASIIGGFCFILANYAAMPDSSLNGGFLDCWACYRVVWQTCRENGWNLPKIAENDLNRPFLNSNIPKRTCFSPKRRNDTFYYPKMLSIDLVLPPKYEILKNHPVHNFDNNIRRLIRRYPGGGAHRGQQMVFGRTTKHRERSSLDR